MQPGGVAFEAGWFFVGCLGDFGRVCEIIPQAEACNREGDSDASESPLKSLAVCCKTPDEEHPTKVIIYLENQT